MTTTAGRALLDEYLGHNRPPEVRERFTQGILAIEAEAAALDVERIVPDGVPAHVIDMEATFLAHTERASGEAALRHAVWWAAGHGDDHYTTYRSGEMWTRPIGGLDVERFARALLDSGLVARYNEYARQAHPNSMLLESDEAVARGWAPFVAAAYREAVKGAGKP